MPSLWQSDSLSEALGQKVGGFEASGVSIDTRTLKAGDIFVALQGENFNGAKFIPQAFAKGAVAVITETDSAHKKIKIIHVASCQQALEQLGAYARARTEAVVVGITGSVGKTGVKDALALALEAYAAPKSFNNHWGVPLTLARLKVREKFAIIEMGMNHAGEIKALSELTRPDAVLITQIAPAHIGFLGTLEKIAHAKAEIFDGLNPQGQVVLNRDDEFFEHLSQAAAAKTNNIYSFGSGTQADGRLLSCSPSEQGAAVTAEIFGTSVAFSQYVPAQALALNSVAVLTMAHVLGADLNEAAHKLSQLEPRAGRGKREVVGGITLIDESYNANPASMAAALESLGNLRGRTIAVLGDMAELGAAAAHYHQALLEPTCKNAALVFLCGEEMKALYDILPPKHRGGYALTGAALLENIVPKLQKGDKILVKGSQKMALASFISQLKEQL